MGVASAIPLVCAAAAPNVYAILFWKRIQQAETITPVFMLWSLLFLFGSGDAHTGKFVKEMMDAHFEKLQAGKHHVFQPLKWMWKNMHNMETQIHLQNKSDPHFMVTGPAIGGLTMLTAVRAIVD